MDWKTLVNYTYIPTIESHLMVYFLIFSTWYNVAFRSWGAKYFAVFNPNDYIILHLPVGDSPTLIKVENMHNIFWVLMLCKIYKYLCLNDWLYNEKNVQHKGEEHYLCGEWFKFTAN